MPELIGKVFLEFGAFPPMFCVSKGPILGLSCKMSRSPKRNGTSGPWRTIQEDMRGWAAAHFEFVVCCVLQYAFSAFAWFSPDDCNLFLAVEIKVIMQVDVKEYRLTNCHIGEMEELCGEEEAVVLQTGIGRAYSRAYSRVSRHKSCMVQN